MDRMRKGRCSSEDEKSKNYSERKSTRPHLSVVDRENFGVLRWPSDNFFEEKQKHLQNIR